MAYWVLELPHLIFSSLYHVESTAKNAKSEQGKRTNPGLFLPFASLASPAGRSLRLECAVKLLNAAGYGKLNAYQDSLEKH